MTAVLCFAPKTALFFAGNIERWQRACLAQYKALVWSGLAMRVHPLSMHTFLPQRLAMNAPNARKGKRRKRARVFFLFLKKNKKNKKRALLGPSSGPHRALFTSQKSYSLIAAVATMAMIWLGIERNSLASVL